MKFKRIGRILVCLLLICCLTFHAMIPRAEASSIGAAATIVKASTVTCNPYIIGGAILIALGVAAGVESGAFETVANNCVNALEAAGTWFKDGVVELLRTEDADGNASYYVDSGLMEDVRSWIYDSATVSFQSPTSTTTTVIGDFTFYTTEPVVLVSLGSDKGSYWSFTYYLLSTNPFQYYTSSNSTLKAASKNGCYYRVWYGERIWQENSSESIGSYQYYCGSHYLGVYNSDIWNTPGLIAGDYTSTDDITLGVLPAQSSDLTDGTSARAWSEDYTDLGLKVYGGGSGNNNNDGKWFWKVMIPLTAVDLLAMSQADAWAGNTPQEFDDYDTKEELKVMDTPEVEFGFGIVLEPDTGDSSGSDDPTESIEPTTPGGLPDIGGGDNPDPGGDGNTGTESGNQTDYTNWFERIIKGIEELPSKFESWITDCKTAIEELPSKFAEWFNNIATQLERIIEGITTLGQNIAQSLQTLGQNIVEGIRNAISSLFTPSPDYFTNKVEALKAKHHNIDKFTQLGNDFKLFFTGLGSKPPIIWIDLSAATGAYLWGGRQIFLDLTWYADYKPKMDAILGAIIWLWLAWRVFLSVPGIINGASGVWGKYHRGGSRDDN